MSWYNDNIQNGFIDTTQEFVGGGGEGGGTVDLTAVNTAIANLQTELLSAQTNFNNISADFNDIKAVFIPKQINNQNIVETYIKNTFTNSIIYIVNNNTQPKVKIENGHLYVYYDYNELVSVLDPSQFIKVSDYLIGVNVGIRNLNALASALGLQLGDVVNDVNGMSLIQGQHALAISTLVSDVKALKAVDVIIIDTLNAMNAGIYVQESERFVEIGNATVYNEILTNTFKHLESIKARTWTFSNLTNVRFLLDNKFTLLFWGAVFVVGGNPQLAVDVLHTFRDFFIGEKINENIKQLSMSYDLAKTTTGFDTKNKLLHTGLAITFGNGGLADGEYDITLRTDNVITVKVTGGIATVTKVKSSDEQHTVGDFFNKNRSLLGGGDGLIRFTVTALYSTKEILEYEINTKFLEIEDIKGRQRRREKIINEDALGDNFTIEYTPLTETTGEISQVPTIKLNYNTTQFESINGELNIKTDGDILTFSKLGYGFTTETIGDFLKVKLNLNTTHFEIIENVIYIKGYITADSLVPINTSINTLTTNVSDLQTDVGAIETNLLGINTTISGIQGDIAGIDTEITNANSAITTLQTDLSALETDVATILGVNSDVVDLLDDVATLKTNVIDINGNIAMINGNINVIDTDIVDVNESLERVYKVLLPTGSTMTSDYRMNLGFKEIYSGYPYDLMMLAVRSGIYSIFNADDYNNDFLGLMPNMIRLVGTQNYRVYDTDQLAVNPSQYFTKGDIYFNKINENYITNLNNKFEFVSFLKFVSFNNNTTDYPIIQSTDALGVISNTKLKVWLRNRKLNISHPALVSYLINEVSATNFLTTYIINNSYVSLTVNDDNLILASTIIPKATPEYKYKISFLNNTWAVHLNNDTRFARIINDAYTSEPANSEDYLRMYLSHPNNPNLPIASGVYPSLVLDIGKLTNGTYDSDPPPTNIKRITIKFAILYTTMYGSEDEQPRMNLYNYAETVERCDFTFRFRYSFDGVNFTNYNFTMGDVSPNKTVVGNKFYDGFGSFVGANYFDKNYYTFTFDIAGTYPAGTGQKVKYVEFSLVKKAGATYQYGTTTDKRYNFQPILYLFKYIINDYNVVGTPYTVVANNYTTTDVSNAFSTSIFSTSWYLFALQLDLPNNNIGFYLKGIYNNFATRSDYTLTSANITMPDTSVSTINSTFVSWANLTQQNGDLVIGNVPSVGSVNFTHFNWRFFQDYITEFLTLTEIQKLTTLIDYGYYEQYVDVDKLLTAGEIITYNLDTPNITLNKKQLIKPMTDTIRARDLRTEQTQDPVNVLIRLDNLYVEDPVSSGNIYYDRITKTFTVGGGGGGGGGIGTRAEEDEIILGFIEDSAGYALMWDNVTNKLNVVPEYLYQDFTPIYDAITLSRTQTSNYVEATSNYLKNIIDNIPTATPYDDTAVYQAITLSRGDTSNYVDATSNYLKGVIDNLPPPTPAYNDAGVYQAITLSRGDTSNYVDATSNYLKNIIDSLPPPTPAYNDTAVYQAITLCRGDTSNYVDATSNYLKGVIDSLPAPTPAYNDAGVYQAITLSRGDTSNYVDATSNYLKGVIDSLPPPTPAYDDTAVYQAITTTSNILLTDFVARDAVLKVDYIARDDIITADSIERDDNLSASIEVNKYTDAKVASYLGNYDNKIINGFVGIGTTNPLSQLEIKGQYATLRIVDSDTGTLNPKIDLIRGTGLFGSDATADWRIENLTGLFKISRQLTSGNPDFLNCISIFSNGNIGFGIDIPQARFHGHASTISTRVATKYTDGTTTAGLGRGFDVGKDGNQNAFLENWENTPMIFTTNATERMRILNNGDVGIGTNAVPFAKLHLHKSGASQDVRIQFTDGITGATANDGVIVGKLPDGKGFLFNYENAELFFGTNGTQRMMITATGNVGIGTATTTSKLRVEGSCTINGFMTAYGTISGGFLSVTNAGMDMLGIPVTTTTGSTYYSSIRVVFGTFTGFHRCYTSDILYNEDESDIFKNKYAGRLVVATGKIKTDYSDENNEWKSLYDKEGITYEDAVPIVELSRCKKDKRIFGVLGLPTRISNNKNRLIVNSVGEGAICVANSNGNIENGDYLQSSDLLGYAERQDDDILHNYSVAKATMDCNFELNSPYYQSYEENGVIYALIACSYHCG
jgi:hypothetical protein